MAAWTAESHPLGSPTRKRGRTIPAGSPTRERGETSSRGSLAYASGYQVWLTALVFLTGCRLPDPPIVEDARLAVHYDTDYERTGLVKSKRALLDGVWAPYVDTLSEPVAIVDWREGASTWEVFYATNRNPLGSMTNLPRMYYGNDLLLTPRYGRAEVVVAKRPRGQDPKRSAGAKSSAASSAATTGGPTTTEVDNAAPLSREDFFAGVNRQIERSRQKDLLLFVHGFNVDFDACLIRAAQLSLDMPFNGAVVAYSWPTRGGAMNYRDDEPVNASSVQPFTEFLASLTAAVPKKTRINIVVHSMGNRIVMQTLNRLVPPNREKPFANVCLCAPDVGLSDYKQWIPGVVAQSRRVTLYANESDSALTLSKGLHSEARAGDAAEVGAFKDVELIDCSRVDLSFLGHSYFSGNVSVLSDLFAVIKEDKPAEKRTYLKAESSAKDGTRRWAFDKHPNQLLWTWHFDREPLRTADAGAADERASRVTSP